MVQARPCRGPESGISLASVTSFKIGGWAREFHLPESLEELAELLRAMKLRGQTPFILGGGANTLFPDGEFQPPVISTERLRRIDGRGTLLKVECGVRLNTLVQTAIRRGLAGLEGLVGIPGSAGGAVIMNAGGGGWSFGNHVEAVGLLPLEGGPLLEVRGGEVPWGYRSAGIKGHVVAWVALRLRAGNPSALRRRARELMLKKAATQPLGVPSAGCVFKNPPGMAAARLIDQLGLKGLECGGARVSERHANFIVNEGGKARSSDVIALVTKIRSLIEASFGVWLETEIVLA